MGRGDLESSMKFAGRPARARMRLGDPRERVRSARASEPSPRSPAPVRPERALAVVDSGRGVMPDLLHAEPAVSVDEAALLHALSFAFIAGGAGGSLHTSLSRTAVAASSFTPETLQDGLFLDELLSTCFDFQLAGKPAPIDRAQLRRLFTRPPERLADVQMRQAILAELVAQPELEQALVRLYAALSVLPALLDDEASDSLLDPTEWRLDVLRALAASFRALDPSFALASSSLRRLHGFGERIRGSDAYARLEALLDFEGDSARGQLEIRLGADGRIRALEIVALRERRDSPFHLSPLRRALRRLLAWLSGYRIGPMEVVERWLESVFDGVREHIPALLQLKGDLEFYLGALHFKRLALAKGLPVCLPELALEPPRTQRKRIALLWNPLLLSQPRPPVPTDVDLPHFAITSITTGPNSGGKTRFLQALALSQLLGQAGSFVPAERALIRPMSGMFVSLGEAPHVDQKEGRLGMELVRIRKLFERAHAGSFVVLDELCSGTNPSEGEEIFRMLLELLNELDHEVHITTHFLSFASTLQAEADALGLTFLQVELDEGQHATFRFVPGVATTSLAQQTAERLGVTRDQLRALIRNKP